MTGTDENMRRVRYDDVEFDDQLALVDGRPFTGIIFDLFPDGRTAAEYQYREGLPEGLQREWHRSGGLKKEAVAVRGHGSSEVKEWFESGQLKSVSRAEFGWLTHVTEWREDGALVKDEAIRLDEATLEHIERMRQLLKKGQSGGGA
jgi:antitoxin component YwqK of YwqJK toxin-antitoxin module